MRRKGIVFLGIFLLFVFSLCTNHEEKTYEKKMDSLKRRVKELEAQLKCLQKGKAGINPSATGAEIKSQHYCNAAIFLYAGNVGDRSPLKLLQKNIR